MPFIFFFLAAMCCIIAIASLMDESPVWVVTAVSGSLGLVFAVMMFVSMGR